MLRALRTGFLALLSALLFPLLAAAQLVTTISGTGESMTIVLSGAKATTDATYAVTHGGSGEPVSLIGTTNGTTPVTMVAGAAGTPKQIYSLVLYNADTAAITATINKISALTTYPLQKITLPVGATLRWTGSETRVMDSSGQLLQTITDTSSVGAAAASGNAATEVINGVIHQTTLTLNDVSVAMVDATIQGGSTKIYDFPEGRVLVLGCTASLAPKTTSTVASTINAGVAGVWALGTAVATADAALTSTEADLLPSTAWTSSTTINVAAATVTGALASSAQFDGTTTAKDMYLSACVTGATDIDADGTVAWSGTVKITWILLGDY